MKKLILIPLVVGLISGVTLTTQNPMKQAHSHLDTTKKVRYFDAGELNTEIDQLISPVESSEYVIKARLLDKKPANSDGSLYEYKFSVLETLKGEMTENEINVFESGFEFSEEILDSIGERLLFETGSDYYLFLESWEDEYYPTTIYTNVFKDAIIKVEDELIYQTEMFGKLNNEAELVNKIDTYMKKSNNKIKKIHKKIKNKAKDINELSSLSDYIGIVKPIEVIQENDYIKVVRVSITKNIIGKLQKDSLVYLPNDVDVNQEYLIFGNLEEGVLKINTREDSIYEKGTEEFDKVYNDISNLQ
ncbi:hypothetical protein FZC84_15375 [Rossellomorea vietnamensis]|uniref:Uncharacterized protein n=1 Tax=Rossellomorea vietnamensis TaxID=218284 RepID=A0A5D4M8N2_9BACI|nr:hypothetical protein [Rossellomorea vietnamensis]TYR98289.1 hypothetical protein FZC84_15375 [Rossellomorea vietnamensis]